MMEYSVIPSENKRI